MAKFSFLAAALCALALSGSVNAFSVSRLQTRLEAKSMAHSAVSKITPFDHDDNIMPRPALKMNKVVTPSKKTTHMKSIAKAALSFVVIASTITSVASPAYAKAAKATEEVVEHLHVGQKVANYFRSFGIPDLAILAIISAMPVVELRGAGKLLSKMIIGLASCSSLFVFSKQQHYLDLVSSCWGMDGITNRNCSPCMCSWKYDSYHSSLVFTKE